MRISRIVSSSGTVSDEVASLDVSVIHLRFSSTFVIVVVAGAFEGVRGALLRLGCFTAEMAA